MKTIVCLVAALAVLFVNSYAVETVRPGEIPHRVRVFPSNPNPGDTVTIEVELTGVVGSNQAVAITGTSGFWSSLPSSVTVLQGNDKVTFQGTIDPNTQTGGSVTATCNGGSAGANIML